MKKAILTLAAIAATTAASPARAFDESTRRPFYIQTQLGSGSYWPVLFGDQGYWHPEIEFGLHFTGRHDGLVLGVRQAFEVGNSNYSGGETLLRGGWDFAVPFRNGRFELTLAPYGTFGANYIFKNLQAGVHFTVGFESKLFFFKGLYLLVRPIELGFGQFVYVGFPGAQNVYFTITAGAGLGYAF